MCGIGFWVWRERQKNPSLSLFCQVIWVFLPRTNPTLKGGIFPVPSILITMLPSRLSERKEKKFSYYHNYLSHSWELSPSSKKAPNFFNLKILLPKKLLFLTAGWIMFATTGQTILKRLAFFFSEQPRHMNKRCLFPLRHYKLEQKVCNVKYNIFAVE